jgi:Dolichyl-phosphate-mannose-protein mannosyltransferase
MIIVGERVAISGGAKHVEARDNGTRFLGIVAMALVAITAIAALWDGQHIEPRDSPTYLAAAEAFANGDGYRVPFGDRGKPVAFDAESSPVIDFPPGYPFVLSLGVRLGFDAAETARALAILCSVAVAGLFYRVTRLRSGSAWAALMVGSIAGLWTVRMSVAVLSEALFGLTISLALVAAAVFIRKRKMTWFVAAAMLAAFSVTIRTVGLAVVLAVAVAAWIGFTGIGRRLIWSAATLGAGLFAFAGLVAGGNRVMAWHPPDAASIKITIDALVSLIVPPVGTPWIRLALFLIAAIAIVVLARRAGFERLGRPSMGAEIIPLVAALAQIGLVLATRALFDAQTDLNPRLMFPIALALLLALAEYSARSIWIRRPGMLRTGVAFVAVLALISAGLHVWANAAELREPDGLRWASPAFQQSEAVAYLNGAGSPTVFSNIPDGLWIVGFEGARALPVVFDPLSLDSNDRLDAEMGRLAEALVEEDAVVFYHRDSDFGYLVEEPELREIASCVLVDDGRSVVLTATSNGRCDA